MNNKILTIGGLIFATSAISTLAAPERSHRGERPNPEDLVIEIVANYDANTDNVIDINELETAIVGIHEKRMEKMKEIAENRGFDGERPRRGGTDGGRRAPDPSNIAGRLISDFDDNGDEVLDTEELMGAVRALHSGGPRKGGPRGHSRKGDGSAHREEVE